MVTQPKPEAEWPQDPHHEDQLINGTENIKEALGFIKDWVTTVITIQTAAIGAVAVLLKVGEQPIKLRTTETLFISAAMLGFLFSIICGSYALNMLPGCAQRKPKNTEDVYALRTKRLTLNFWTSMFRYSFLGGLIFFAIFMAAHTFGWR